MAETAEKGCPTSVAHCARSFTAQVACNTDCCGFGVQHRRVNFGIRDETQFRFAFAIGNLGTVGPLRKQDRLFRLPPDFDAETRRRGARSGGNQIHRAPRALRRRKRKAKAREHGGCGGR
jgi:hypothetical protein